MATEIMLLCLIFIKISTAVFVLRVNAAMYDTCNGPLFAHISTETFLGYLFAAFGDSFCEGIG